MTMEREMVPGVDDSSGRQTRRIFGKATDALRRARPCNGRSSCAGTVAASWRKVRSD